MECPHGPRKESSTTTICHGRERLRTRPSRPSSIRCAPRSSASDASIDLNIRAYVDNPDAEVVAIVDTSEERRVQRQAEWPDATTFASVDELIASDVEVDAVELLLPTTQQRRRRDGLSRPEGGTSTYKNPSPMTSRAPTTDDRSEARRRGLQLRVMENYLFYEPLHKLKEIIDSGELGRDQRLPHEDGGERTRRLGGTR